MVHGPAYAGGCELALHCDFRVAADPARFAMPLAKLGLVVPFPLGQKLVEIIGPAYTRQILLTGQPVDARSDIYSAALVIHESLTCQLPYVSGKKLCELCPEAMPALQDLLDQCLRPNPNERPPSAVEVYLRLQELGKASGILLLPPGAMDRLVAARQAESMQPTVMYQPSKGRLTKVLLWGGLGLAALGLLGWLAWYVWLR